MRKFKRIFAAIIAVILMLSFAACGNSGNNAGEDETQSYFEIPKLKKGEFYFYNEYGSVYSAEWETVTADLSFNNDISAISGCTALKYMHIEGGSGKVDLTPLASCTNLSALYIDMCGNIDFSPLAACKNLKEIYIYKTSMDSLESLKEITGLQALYISGGSISDVSPLASMAGLKKLCLNGNSVSDLDPLASLENLSELYIESNEVSALPALKNLSTLDISYNPVTSIDFEGFDALKSLTAKECLLDEETVSSAENFGIDISVEITDEQVITNFYTGEASAATELYISQFPSDLSALKDFTSLKKLLIEGTPSSLCTRNIEAIAECSGVTELTINKGLSDISWISSMDNLEILNLQFNNIEDYSPLYGLRNLKELYISSNPFTAEDLTALKEAIPDTTIYAFERYCKNLYPEGVYRDDMAK